LNELVPLFSASLGISVNLFIPDVVETLKPDTFRT
jgi:hypothetical protein